MYVRKNLALFCFRVAQEREKKIKLFIFREARINSGAVIYQCSRDLTILNYKKGNIILSAQCTLLKTQQSETQTTRPAEYNLTGHTNGRYKHNYNRLYLYLLLFG